MVLGFFVLVVASASAVAGEGPRPVGEDSWVRLIVRDATRDMENALGVRLKDKVAVYLCGSKDEMERVTGNRHPCWALAVASPAQGIIAINGSKLRIATGNDIGVAIRHEMVHMILGGLPSRPPLWFEEGTAEVLSGRPVGEAPDELRMAAQGGGLIPLADIAGKWPEDAAHASLAYAQGASAVLYLLSEYGSDALRGIARGLADGRSFDEAFRLGSGSRLSTFEKRWEGSLKEWHWGVTLLALLLRPPYIYTALSVLAIVAAVVVLIKRRFAMKRLEEEEPWS